MRVDFVIDGALRKRVLDRLGKASGDVAIEEESWNLGFCETCDYPESGFSVKVDGELVWPSREYLNDWGGYIYADSDGHVTRGKLSSYGQFDAWLNGREWDAESD